MLSIKQDASPLVRNIWSSFEQYFEPKINRHSLGIWVLTKKGKII